MDNVNKTLYIPLYGKAYVSKKGILLKDKKAEEIWEAEGFALKGKARSKWLAYYMGMRSAVFDRWLTAQMKKDADAAVLHVGCGMDSRCLRVEAGGRMWTDLDFPEVIRERRRYYAESSTYCMLDADIRQPEWLAHFEKGQDLILVMEGVSMYLKPQELQKFLKMIGAYFGKIHILMDCYTVFAAKMSRYKNPINEVGVTGVFGVDAPLQIIADTGISFVKEHEMTPAELTAQLYGIEKAIFEKLYGGRLSKKMYRLYEFEKK